MKPLNTVLKPLFLTVLLAGTLDGLAAVIMYCAKTGKDPMNVFRYVASGVFGSDAFAGGTTMAIWGIVFHFIIALGWTVLFSVFALRVSMLTKHWPLSGVVYGLVVWLAMSQIVVPLSRVPAGTGSADWSGMIRAALILIVCVGLPIAYGCARALRSC